MFKPLLAKEVDLNKLRFPVLASPKLDGIRCVILNGRAVSRTLKPIPNNYVRNLLEATKLPAFDGELIVGPPNDMNTMQRTSSGIMSHGGEPEFKFFVFDDISEPNKPYSDRYKYISDMKMYLPDDYVEVLHHELIHNMTELEDYENICVEAGFEGIMIRRPDGPYKFGRSTVNEGILLKVKRFVDEEAIVIGFEEKMHNANEAKKDARGYTVRGFSQDMLVPADTLGALIVMSEKWGVFNIGTGFDDKTRQWVWDNKEKCLNELCTFKYQTTGIKDKPRTPVFKCFRNRIDMGGVI